MIGLSVPTLAHDVTPPSVAAEALLVARAQHDPANFGPLYEAYLDPIFRYCFYRLGSAQAAEDAASTVFIRALEALPRYRPAARAGSFRSWLFTIAHNVVANQHRATTRRPIAPLAAASVVPDDHPSPEDYALARDDAHTIQSLLARLPAEQRQVVELRLSGLTDQEIAHVLGRSHGAIRTAHYRAVLQLRALFGAQPGESSHD